ncbi:dsDNA nuclease domain-containing protein [Oceanobacillus picturae]|uniref:dsDNA nuclease domain-containing protein n=1 Tax=Oceanobacillus picturae TaxID=171693 RepID=UPI00363AF8E2
MELKNLVSRQKPRENSGSRSANRFDYQKDWAILKLIELHKSGEDYLLVLDYYDDVIVFDSGEEPENVEFFQVKTGKTNWTMKRLLSRKKGKEGKLPSILGKMYACKMQFPDHTLSLNFISNSSLSIDLKDKNKKSTENSEVAFSEICDKKLSEIVDQLKEEHSIVGVPDFVELTFYRKTNLALVEREPFIKGKLGEYLEELDPKGMFRLSLVYNSLFDEVKRKNNYEGDISDFKDLAHKKGISRDAFDSMINQFTRTEKIEEDWTTAEQRFNNEGVPFGVIRRLKKSWDLLKIERLDLTKTYLQEIITNVSEIIKLSYGLDENIQYLYRDVIEKAYQEYCRSYSLVPYSEYDIKAIILMEYLSE